MSSKQATAADGGAAENSEGGTTVALQKKRLRRVSFAEMTSVHFFDRDEECNDMSAEELAKKACKDENGANKSEEKSDPLGFRELEDSKGEDEDKNREDGDGESDDESLLVMRSSFLRPMESPSPGSTFGSATSNDEDNFFGPVSASFIRSGRLSDSAASDDNHDVTMDSTAFSMHFRSLARSESGVDLKTPTGVHLSFEEKTPTLNNAGSSMEITALKKPISQSSSPAMDKSGCSGSSDMSLVGDNPCKYDYGRISPRLDALLAEGSKDLHVISTSHNIVALKSERNLGNMNFSEKENDSGLVNIVTNGKIFSSVGKKVVEASAGSPTSPVTCPTSDFASNISKALALENMVDDSYCSGNQMSEVRRSLSDPYKLSPTERSMHESQCDDLISSSPMKERQLLTSSTSPAWRMLVVTPQEQRNSVLHNDNVKLCDSGASSIQKSISKLKLLEASSFSPSLTAAIENPTLQALDILKPSRFRSILEKGLNNYHIEHPDAPTTDVEGPPSTVSSRLREIVDVSRVVHNKIEDVVDGGHIIHAEESAAAATSPSQFTRSATKRKHDLLRTKSPNEIKLVTAGTDSSSAEIALDYIGERKTGITSMRFVPSADNGFEKRSISLSHLESHQSNDMLLHNRIMELKKLFPGQGSASRGAIIDANLSASPIGKFDSFSVGKKEPPPVVGFNHSNLTEISATDDIQQHYRQSTFEVIENPRTPTREEASESFQPKNVDWNPKKVMDISILVSDLPGGESEPAASDSVAPSVHRNLTELTFQKTLVDCFAQNMSKKEVQAFSSDNVKLHEVEDVLSPLCNELNTPTRKRSNEVVLLEEIECRNGVAAFQRSPKLQRISNCNLGTVGSPNEDGEVALVIARELKHWIDIYSNSSKVAEKLLSPPINKLNHTVIESLEDVLFSLRRSKTYAMLRNEIFAQKTSFANDLCQQRVGEARLLLHQILHEKAKLQLMRLKRQNLLERVQLLNSRLQNSQMLKLNFLSGYKGDAQAGGVDLQILCKLKQRDEVPNDKVTAMKQALATLDKKTACLIKSLTTSCNVRGEPSCADSIPLVNELLMKKSCCRSIRLDMQMWVVGGVNSTYGHQDIVLNYLDVIFQSFKLPVSPASSIVISNRLDDTNITKNFPNMDACIAFSFVFNAETTQKYSGSRILAQETQVTCSLLGNLVDVVQELQLAQIELRSLTRTTFHCPSVGQLNLHICFINFKNGWKVTLTLDLSCLNRGIYPLEIFPWQLIAANAAKVSLAEPILGEIRDAIKSLRAGYLRLLRLCRCVSQVIEDSRY